MSRIDSSIIPGRMEAVFRERMEVSVGRIGEHGIGATSICPYVPGRHCFKSHGIVPLLDNQTGNGADRINEATCLECMKRMNGGARGASRTFTLPLVRSSPVNPKRDKCN